MIFVFPITIPPNTPQTAPIVTSLQLTAGTITQVSIQVPSGVLALASIALFNGLYQLFPSNPESAFATSNETITWIDQEEISQPPYALTAKAWNTDSVNAHTLTVRIVMLPPAAVQNLAAEVAALLSQGTTAEQ